MIKRVLLGLTATLVVAAVAGSVYYMNQPKPKERPTFCPSQGVTLEEFSRCMENLLQTDTNNDGKIG